MGAKRSGVFISFLLLAVLVAGGSAHAAFPGENGRIAFVRTFTGILTVNPDGTHLTRLHRGSFPAWSADGEQIGFTHARGDTVGISVMDADGTGLLQLTRPHLPIADSRPSWSPDGAHIAFTRRREDYAQAIFTVNADGTGLRRITEWGFFYESPAWSPDGSRIAFTGEDDNVWLMDPDGSDLVRLTFEGAYKRYPNWSPDGQRIIWSRNNVFGIKGDLWIMNADGTGQQNLTTTDPFSEQDPAWSPDGTRIAFVGDPGNDGSGHIYVMNADGSGVMRLVDAHTTNNFGPDWQPVPVAPP